MSNRGRGGPLSPARPLADLVSLTAELIDVASVSGGEAPLVERLEAALRDAPWLRLDRVGDNLVARTELGAAQRVILAGHTDTVPPNGNERARIEGDCVWGLGAADMKGGLAVMLELARTVSQPALDVTYVFYAREEVASVHSGLAELARLRPELLRGDVAFLGEPTGGGLEAGCQGTLRLEVTLAGVRAHTARPWMGRNAVHRLAPILSAVAAYEPRRPVLDGCEFREALQAVAVRGGVAGNVVPDSAGLTLNFRFAPDRSAAEAEAHVRRLLAPHLEAGDEAELTDVARAAPPALTHPAIARVQRRGNLAVTAKLGWTDVARFADLGVPAVNFGPGESTLAHAPDERVTRSQLDGVYAALHELLVGGC
ncbi:MAG: succinyl-diaminopimelate desuccinylase [Acidimicrobiales bacterium]